MNKIKKEDILKKTTKFTNMYSTPGWETALSVSDWKPRGANCTSFLRFLVPICEETKEYEKQRGEEVDQHMVAIAAAFVAI